MLSALSNAAEKELTDQMAEFYADPLGFVLFSYAWGEPGELKLFNGPDDWQRELLARIMHKLLSTLIFLPFFVETGGSSLEWGVDAGWEEASEVSGEKRVDF